LLRNDCSSTISTKMHAQPIAAAQAWLAVRLRMSQSEQRREHLAWPVSDRSDDITVRCAASTLGMIESITPRPGRLPAHALNEPSRRSSIRVVHPLSWVASHTTSGRNPRRSDIVEYFFLPAAQRRPETTEMSRRSSCQQHCLV
jgi:hypothetical protein